MSKQDNQTLAVYLFMTSSEAYREFTGGNGELTLSPREEEKGRQVGQKCPRF